jgi:hypothetical protein
VTAEAILSRLEAVRSRGGDRWSARCPAHEDKSPSLAIRELPDGRLLLYCHAGCSSDEVVGAVGLEMSDLFPPKPSDPGAGHSTLKRRALMSPAQALEIVANEVMLAWTAAYNLAGGHKLTAADLARLTLAAKRIEVIRDEVMQ